MKKIVLGFKIVYLLNMLVAFTAFWNGTKWFYYSNYILILGAAFGAVYLLIQWKSCMKAGNVWLITLFLISYLFSSVMTIRFGIGDNLKELIWMFLPMGFLYMSAFLLTQKERELELGILGGIYILYCTVLNVLSVSMVWWGRNYLIGNADGTTRVVGYKWGRLWGGYDDPNHGASIAAIAVIIAVYFVIKVSNWFLKILLVLSMLVQYAYIVCSDSRTGFVSLAVGTGVFAAWFLFRKLKGKKEAFRILLSAGVAGCIAAIVVVGSMGLNKRYDVLDKKIQAEWNRRHPAVVQAPVNPKETRANDIKKDSSSGRMEIWKSGLEIFAKSPIYGVSYRNMTAYAHERVPDTYIINTTYDIDYDSMHNMPLDVLVSQGIIGIILLLSLFVNSLMIYIKRYKLVKKENQAFAAVSIAVVLGLGAGSMFLTSIIYLSGPHAYWFWLCLGYAIALLQQSGEGEEAQRKIV